MYPNVFGGLFHYLCQGGRVFGSVSACKHGSSKRFEVIPIKLCRGVDSGQVSHPLKCQLNDLLIENYKNPYN